MFSRRAAAKLIATGLLVPTSPLAALAARAAADSRTFFVDATGGSDDRDGLSEQTAWRTLRKVNGSRFEPGDTILLKRGEVWYESLIPPSSGRPGRLITFGAYGSGRQPQVNGSDAPHPSRVLALIRVNHIRLQDLHFTRGQVGIECSKIAAVTGCEFINCTSNFNTRNGIWVRGGTKHCLWRGGASHDNGEDEATTKSGKVTALGHGIKFSDQSHDNRVEDMALFHNAEDGVQIQTSGGNLVVQSCRLFGNREDGADLKEGSIAFIDCIIEGNSENAINAHVNGGTLMLKGCRLRTVEGGNALDLRGGYRVISVGNVYQGVNSSTLELADSAADDCSFESDLFIEGGLRSTHGVDLRGGSGHRFRHCTFYKSSDGENVRLRDAVTSASFENCIFATKGASHIRADKNVAVRLSANLYDGCAKGEEWVRLGDRRYDQADIREIDAKAVTGDPLFADPSDGRFQLRTGSPAIAAGQSIGVEADHNGRPFNKPPSIGAFEKAS